MRWYWILLIKRKGIMGIIGTNEVILIGEHNKRKGEVKLCFKVHY